MDQLLANLVVLGHTFGAVALGWLYFRRHAVKRPPIGVFNLADVGFILGGIVLVPFLYLALPLWLVAGLLALGALSAVYFAAEPALRASWAPWAVLLLLGAAEIGALLQYGPRTVPFFAVNNLVMVAAVVGITNLRAQSGMKARDTAVLGGALTVYDFVATAQLPLMGDLVVRVSGLPFAPLVAWPVGPDGLWLGIGMGDLLLATVFPLVLRKAYGRAAGLVALATGLAAIVGLFALTELVGIEAFPVMVALGPLMVVQYGWWARLRGPERTTGEYLRAEPTRRPVALAA